ncbi:sortase-dependent protein [Streptomyces sp. NPDC058665]|uniref:sortase-dependent protein n=1 Tax=Streptomyces sp. NPDC058665 TaxID=3346586 RepID=UPI00364DD729
MRRTVLSAMALASTAVLAGTVPAFADAAAPTATPVPSTRPTREAAPAPAEPSQAVPAPARTRTPSQVAVVPEGAPNTGVAPAASKSGTDSALIGTGAAALVAGGAAVYVVRRRRATGA